MKIEFDYRDAPTIRRFSECDKFLRGLMGPFGSGKSSGCVVEIVSRAHAQAPGPDGIRRSRWGVIRNTYPQLRDTTIKTVHQWLPPPLFGRWNKTEHTYLITGFRGVEIEILFRALDRPDQVDNLLSLELTGAWVNEAREVPWTIIQALQGRVGRYPAPKDGGPTWHGIFMDTNPPDEDSWWYQLFEERKPNNAALFKQPSGLSDEAENRPNLPDGYYENMLESMDEDTAKVYIHGQYGFIRDGKPVYPEYNDNLHCREVEPVPGLPIHRGWDFGLTPACVFSQVTPDGRWIVFDEIVPDRMGADNLSDEGLLHCSQEYPDYEFADTGDPAGEQGAQTDESTCFEILRGKGIDIEGGEQDLESRLGSVRKPLKTLVDGKPQFQLHPRCRVLRKGFQGRYKYRRMMTAEEKYTDKPDKNEYSHPHDALQYTATRLFGDALRNARRKREIPKTLPETGHVGAGGWMI